MKGLPARRRQDQKQQEQRKRKPRKKTEARKEIDREKLEKKWQERRKKQQQQSMPLLPPQPAVLTPAAPVGAARPPGLPSPPLQVASSTPTSMAAADADVQPEGMDESGVTTHAAGGKRVAPRSPAAAKAIAAIRAERQARA